VGSSAGSPRVDFPSVCDVSEVPGRDIGKFLLVCRAGRGGMGEVWKAWSKDLRREVAIKFAAGQEEEDARRFFREAQLAGRLHHPNIVPVYDVGEYHGRPYLVMPWIDGTTIEMAELGHEGLVRAMVDIASAVDYAHREGVIHRDIKPQNILVSGATPYVTDFGLARQRSTRTSLTVSGMVVGTPEYMSPEQAMGRHALVDERADVYSLGATLYRLATGIPPYDGADPVTVLSRVVYGDPPAPRKVRPTLPRDLETIILCAMARERRHRYRSAGALAEDLRKFLNGEPIGARRPGTFHRLQRQVRRHRGVVSVLAVTLVLLTAGGTAHWFQRRAMMRALVAEREWRREQENRRARARAEFDRGVEFARLLEGSLSRPDGSAADERRLVDGALDRFRSALEMDPECAPAAYHVARIQLELDHPAEAREWCSVAIRVSPRLAAAYLLRAQIDFERYQALRWDPENGTTIDSGDASKILRTIQEDLECAKSWESGAVHPHYSLGLWALVRGKWAECVEAWRQYLEERPEDWRLHQLLATVLQQAGQSEIAFEHADRAVRIRPRSASSVSRRGLAHLRLGRVEAAREDADRALSLRPDQPQSWLTRSICRKLKGDFSGSVLDMDRYLSAYPTDRRVWFHRGNVALHLKRLKEAESNFSRALEIDPTYAEAWLNRAVVRFRTDDLAGALLDLAVVLDLRPGKPEALAARGKIRRRCGDLPGAIADYTAALVSRPLDPDLHYSRGNARRDLADLGGALCDFLEAVHLDPKRAEAQANLGLLYETLADRQAGVPIDLLGSAERHLARAVEVGGENWSYRASAEGWLARVRLKLRKVSLPVY